MKLLIANSISNIRMPRERQINLPQRAVCVCVCVCVGMCFWVEWNKFSSAFELRIDFNAIRCVLNGFRNDMMWRMLFAQQLVPYTKLIHSLRKYSNQKAHINIVDTGINRKLFLATSIQGVVSRFCRVRWWPNSNYSSVITHGFISEHKKITNEIFTSVAFLGVRR